MKNKIGIIVISIAFVISVAVPYSVLRIGIPMFILGVLLLWMSEAERKTRLKWSIIPVVLYFPFSLLWIFIYNSIGGLNAQKRDFYVNYDFKGNFFIAESECGNTPDVEDDRLIFEIPSNGIYLFNGKLKDGHIDERVFIRNLDGSVSRIKNLIDNEGNDLEESTGQELIIGSKFEAFGTRSNSAGSQSGYISRRIITNKAYTTEELWLMKDSRERNLDSLLINCEF